MAKKKQTRKRTRGRKRRKVGWEVVEVAERGVEEGALESENLRQGIERRKQM